MTTTDESRAVVDTNVLIYRLDRASAHHVAAKALLERGRAGDLRLCVTQQVLLEFVRAITHAKMSRAPLAMDRAWKEVRAVGADMDILSPPDNLITRMAVLDASVRIGSNGSFDLAIAATALSHAVEVIYTYDDSVFARVPGLTVRHP